MQVDEGYLRPLDVRSLLAGCAKAKRDLGWEPRVTFRELVRVMVDADMEAAGLTPIGEGARILERKCPDWHRWASGVTAVLNNRRRGHE